MTAPVNTQSGKRRYDSRGRQAAAKQTSARIARTACQHFLTHGYAATRMADIAAGASVSVETLYAVFGSKAGLVRHLLDSAISGSDDYQPPAERAWVQEVEREVDAKRKIALFAAGVRATQERVSPLWSVVVSAAETDGELRDLVDELNRRRVGHMRLFIDHLLATVGLRDDVTPAAATDVVWAMTSPELIGLFVAGRGWSGDAYEAWLATALQRLLLE